MFGVRRIHYPDFAITFYSRQTPFSRGYPMKRLMHRIAAVFGQYAGSATVNSAVTAITTELFLDANTVHIAIESEREFDRLRGRLGSTIPDCPILHGFSAYSQCDEDGIIGHILSRISSRTDLAKTCIEIGAGNGLENNTHYLLLQGFRGYWVDGNESEIAQFRNAMDGVDFHDLKVRNEFLTVPKIQSIVKDAINSLGDEIDLLSIDVDGNDLYFLKEALRYVRPKLIVVEYNAKFPPPVRIGIPYSEAQRWAGDDYHGASLMVFVDELNPYQLVSCNLSGANAFFVRSEFADLFPEYPPSSLYQPLRRHVCFQRPGQHPRSLKFLKDRLLSARGESSQDRVRRADGGVDGRGIQPREAIWGCA
jgi:hypothetical protein